MIRTLRRLPGAKGGAAALEFALVLIPLLLLICGVLEFGRLLWTREALQETAIAGARCMGMSSSSCATGSATTYIEGVANSWGLTLTGTNLTLNSNTTCAGVAAPKGFSSVTITYTFQSVFPGIVQALSGSTALSTTACFPNN
jgi:Flp pilus assembly protein TadG